MLQFEERIERINDAFLERMARFPDSGQAFDMGLWTLKHAVDVVGDIMHGRIGGYHNVRDDKDHLGWMFVLDNLPIPVSINSYVPTQLLRSLFTIAYLVSFRKTRKALGLVGTIPTSAVKAVDRRAELMEMGEKVDQRGMLTGLLKIQREQGKELDFSKKDVYNEVYTSIWAGSDTTSPAMNSCFYHLVKNQECMDKVVKELDEGTKDGRVSQPQAKFSELVKLPYLNAVIKEAMRINPSVGLGAPRYVPKEGADIPMGDSFFPDAASSTEKEQATETPHFFPSTSGWPIPTKLIISLNPSVVHFDTDMYGKDAEVFRPERWLPDPVKQVDEEKARIDRMERTYFAFGAGDRICIGRNISGVEIYKLVATVLRSFELEWARPNEQCTTKARWFCKLEDINVRIKRRTLKLESWTIFFSHVYWSKGRSGSIFSTTGEQPFPRRSSFVFRNLEGAVTAPLTVEEPGLVAVFLARPSLKASLLTCASPANSPLQLRIPSAPASSRGSQQ